MSGFSIWISSAVQRDRDVKPVADSNIASPCYTRWVLLQCVRSIPLTMRISSLRFAVGTWGFHGGINMDITRWVSLAGVILILTASARIQRLTRMPPPVPSDSLEGGA